jgi:hypothetical protein
MKTLWKNRAKRMIYCRDCLNCRCVKTNNPKVGKWDIWCQKDHWIEKRHDLENFLAINEDEMVVREECPDFKNADDEREKDHER